MPLPKSKQELADWMLRRLGAPVINVEISDVQLEDCIDEAVQMYQEYHFDGAQRSWRTICVDKNLLDRNNRIHQDLTAEMYDPSIEYKIGARVMHKLNNEAGNRIFLKHDSEEVTFTLDSENGLHIIDSDGVFVLWVDSDQDFKSDPYGDFVLDSDASNYRLIDSDLDVFDSDFEYKSIAFGDYVLDSDGVTHRLIDSELDYFDSESFAAAAFGDYVLDSDGVSFRLLDSDLDFYGPVDSERFEGIRFTRSTVANPRFTDRFRQTLKPNYHGGRFRKEVSPRYLQERQSLTFEQKWKEEQVVMEEQNVEIAPNGQIGIKLPDNIISVTKLAKVNSFTQAGMWNFEYQYFLNNFDFFYGNGGSGGLSNYYTTKMNVEHIDFMLNTSPAIRFNKHKNRLYVDVDWNRIKSQADGSFYLLAEVYEVTDPDIWGDVYSDTWLKKYATALAKKQWGSNLKKYQNTELPGGIQLSGQELYDEAAEEVNTLEEKLQETTLEMDSIVWG